MPETTTRASKCPRCETAPPATAAGVEASITPAGASRRRPTARRSRPSW